MVNILYCGNDQVFDGMLTSALSVLKRTTSSEPFCFYIFTMDVTRIKPEYNPVPESLAAFFLATSKRSHASRRSLNWSSDPAKDTLA